MAATTTAALLVTANVGSIFEDPSSMLKIWTEEFLATISRLNPKMVALHCQEVGGKNYERSMQHVSDFVKMLMASEELRLFDKVRIYLDEDYSSAEHFTALGNFYFFHESVPDDNIQIYNFQECKFIPVTGKEIHSGNIEAIPTKEKSKFPQEIFPECKWSRKGFMRTRWNLHGTVFDLVNIHLFHDASNFVAMESFPSVYCKNRQRALEHTLKRFHSDQYGIVPFFVFGDFNFRTDTQGVVKKLSEGLNAVRVQTNKSTDYSKLQYTDESSQVVLTLGKKEFSHQDHQKLFVGEDSEWLKSFDRELDSFSGQLFEFTIGFPPTYPYVEDSERGEMYMQTRCPSWCDRVFLSASARALVNNVEEDSCVQYGLIGQNACMGDHKPVYLRASLTGGLGTVSCCVLPAAPCTSCLYAASPVVPYCRLCSEQSVESSSFSFYEEPEQDHNGLVVPAFHRHSSPYTPDSTDTEPDLIEEATFSCDLSFLEMETQHKHRSKYLLPRSSPSNASDLPVSLQSERPALRRGSSSRKSASKIPVHIRDSNKDSTTNKTSSSKIPVLKCKSPVGDKGSNVKGLVGTIPSSKDDSDQELIDEGNTEEQKSTRIPVSVQQVHKLHIPKIRQGEGRKLFCRQNSVDEKSSDSDSTGMEEGDFVKKFGNQSKCEGGTKVEIHLSLSEPPQLPLSPIESDSDMLLRIDSVGPAGSTTDSGVSVSPDLSGATSPSTDGVDKFIGSTNDHGDCTDVGNVKSEEETSTTPSSLERFSLVRRIQSASAMERKSSFPFPSSILTESESPLTEIDDSGSNVWGMRTCRCMSDGSWRQRSSTASQVMLRSRTDSRIRLISTSSNLDMSLPRLQSHHSSSEEEWFEEVSREGGEDEIEDIKNEDGNISVKDQQPRDERKRLPTHLEDKEIKLSLSDLSSDPPILAGVSKSLPSDETGLLSLPHKSSPHPRHPSQSSVDSTRAIVAIGKTLAQTCFVDSQRDVRNDVSVDLNIQQPREKTCKEIDNVGEKEIVEINCPELPYTKNLPHDLVEIPLRSLEQKQMVNSDVERKEQSKSKCKACCIVL